MTPTMDWIVSGGRAALIWIVQLSLIPILIWFERKVSAYMQDRTGPNRAHILGIRLAGVIHNIADVVKLFFKEDITPSGVHRFYYLLAPFIAMMIALMTFAVVPFADTLQLGKLAIPMQVFSHSAGILWVFAIGSFGVFGIIFAGWGANNKFSLLGGIRSSAQLISYELTLSLSIMGLIMIFGTLELNEIVRGQSGLLFGFIPMWGIILQPIGAIIFITSVIAETNRNPFDLPEAESEIVGYHVEYSSMKFALFFMAEYVNIVVASGVMTSLFFGGYGLPWLPTEKLIEHAQPVLLGLLALHVLLALVLFIPCRRWSKRLKELYVDARRHEADFLTVVLLLIGLGALGGIAFVVTNPLSGYAPNIVAAVVQFATFLGKVSFFGFFFVWVRWTLPRYRYDQLMNLGWKAMLPISLANLLLTGLVLLLVDRLK